MMRLKSVKVVDYDGAPVPEQDGQDHDGPREEPSDHFLVLVLVLDDDLGAFESEKIQVCALSKRLDEVFTLFGPGVEARQI